MTLHGASTIHIDLLFYFQLEITIGMSLMCSMDSLHIFNETFFWKYHVINICSILSNVSFHWNQLVCHSCFYLFLHWRGMERMNVLNYGIWYWILSLKFKTFKTCLKQSNKQVKYYLKKILRDEPAMGIVVYNLSTYGRKFDTYIANDLCAS